MKKHNRILTSLLVVVLMFMTVIAAVPMRAEAAYSESSVSTTDSYTQEEKEAIVSETYGYAFDSAEEMLEHEKSLGYLDYVVSKSGKYTIYVNRYTGVMYYKNNTTGQILTSNPYNLSSTTQADIKTDLMSQVFVTFSENSGAGSAGKPYSSAQWAAEYGQISVSKISGGLRVNYTLGDTSTRFLLPGKITADKFETKLMKPMLDYYRDLLWEYIGDRTLPEYSAELDYFKDNERTAMDFYGNSRYDGIRIYDKEKGNYLSEEAVIYYLETTKKFYNEIYDLGGSAEERAVLDDISDKLILFYRGYKLEPQGDQWVYTLNEGMLVADKRLRAKVVKLICPNYTMPDIVADETEVGFVNKLDKKPVFRLSLEYTFAEDGSLQVRLPANSITFDETSYTLRNVSVLRYFGVGDIGEDGYIFVPDGSGAIIEFEDFDSASLTFDMYGDDYCYSSLDASDAYSEQLTMPVYGVVYSEKPGASTSKYSGDKERTDGGYLAIIEQGSSLSSLQVEVGGAHKFGGIYTKFEPFPSDTYNLADTISVGASGEYTIVSKSKYTGSYVTRYVMLADDTVAANAGVDYTPASYVGMATYYRAYLEGRGDITPLEEVNDDLPLYVEAFGSMNVKDKFLTFPITVSIALTEFDDVTTMYDELASAKTVLYNKYLQYKATAEAALKDEDLSLYQRSLAKAERYLELSEEVVNITNVHFKLTGFANGGMYYRYPAKLKWEKACGGKDGFNDLLDSVETRQNQGLNFNIYPEFDFQYLHYTSLFDGISKKKSVSKMVDNRYASKQEFNSIRGEYEPMFAMVISPDALDGLYSKFIKKYSDYDVGAISLSTLGSDLNSNFNKKNPINREEAMSYVVGLLDRVVNTDNMSVMLEKGNIYSVKYADHIIDIPTDSSHYSFTSYSVPFTGLILHGYVNYAGGALNYSGSPDYDLLHAIENGASIYYIMSYRNTSSLKEDEVLNKYYGVDYKNWYDQVVETYDRLNDAIGKYQKYNIVDHTTLIAERVIEESEDAANMTALRNELIEMIEDQIRGNVADAFDSMFDDPENYGRGVKLTVDKTALIAQACELLNLTEDELLATDFDEKLDNIVTKYEGMYNGATTNQRGPLSVEFSAVEYNSKYSYITDSLATDKKSSYVYTDFTIDNDLVTMVTYKDMETGDTVKFIINYNIYSVLVNLGDGQVYELGRYDFVVVK